MQASTRPIRWSIPLFGAFLVSCWQAPSPPKDENLDAYSWRAAIEVAGNDTYYRFALPAEFTQWMAQQNIQSFEVFDATGKVQQCGSMPNGANDPLATIPEVIEGRVDPYDSSSCPRISEAAICVKGQPCSVPDFCPYKQVDLSGTTLEGESRIADILAIANTAVVPASCTPDTPGAARTCDDTDLKSRQAYHQAMVRQADARRFLLNSGLGGPERSTQDIPQSNVRAPSSTRKSSAMMNSQTASSMMFSRASGPPRDFAAPTIPYVFLSSVDTPQEPGGLLVTLDRTPSDAASLKLVWNQPASRGRIGTAKLICYNPGGKTTEHSFDIQANGAIVAGDSVTETLNVCSARQFRIIPKSDIRDLALTTVTATTYAPKPFIKKGSPIHWFKPAGIAPYALFLGTGHGSCRGMVYPSQLGMLPHAREPDWPPEVRKIDMPVAIQRGIWNTFVASHNDLAAWAYWLTFVAGSFALALLGTLVRWAWLVARSPR